MGALAAAAFAYVGLMSMFEPVVIRGDSTPWTATSMKAADTEAWAQWDAWEKRAQTDGRLKTALKAVKTVSRDMELRGWNAPARFFVFDLTYEEIIAFARALRNSSDIPDEILDETEKVMTGWFPRLE